jgi:YbbR domain-containing protein
MATMKLVLGVAIFGLVALMCLKLIPPFFSNYEFEDSIKTEALQSTYSTRSEEDIRTSVIKQARNYDIALTPKQVHVSRTGGFGNGTLNIAADYSVPIELPGYSTTLEFHPSTQNKGVY